MLDRSTPIGPGLPVPGTDVEFVQHRIDWDTTSDLAGLTERRLSALGDSINHGAWYLNPGYSVHAPEPSADFFRVARYAQAQWLRQARQTLSNRGQRREARKAEYEGRRAALCDLAPARNDLLRPQAPPQVVRLGEVSRDLYHPVRESGYLSRRLASSGVMFIDGDLIAPKVWNRRADELLSPGKKPRLTIVNRHVDLDALKATNDLEPVVQLTRHGLQDHLSCSPSLPAYVAPYRTIAAPEPSPEFYLQAKRCHDAWAFLLNRTLSSRVVRRLHREADAPSFILAFSGVLVVDGRLYLKGCWPNQSPGPGHIRKTPFNAPMVPPEFLGVDR
jgi:hypothetical protein